MHSQVFTFCHHNSETLETDVLLLLMDVLVGLDTVNGDSTSPASPSDMKDQVQGTNSDLLHCQSGGSALCALRTSSEELQTHLTRVTSPG